MTSRCYRIILLTDDLPPRRGGVARYHAAVCEALGTTAEVGRPPTGAHWLGSVFALIHHRVVGMVLVGEVLPYGTAAWIASFVTRVPYAVIVHGLDLRNAARVPRKRWLARRVQIGRASW